LKQSVRIIGGTYRGKKIPFPDSQGLRPTPDRVRETLFNWLMHHIRGARCLDAFAGSGALGFEAFSRGASEVYLVEQNKSVFANLQAQAASFKSQQIHVLNTDVTDFIQHTTQQFDIIFLDPPFDLNLLFPCLDKIAASSILSDGGFIYLESAKAVTADPLLWKTIKQKKAGQVCYQLIKMCNAQD
jgi:16S rRNA (guanine966-N2)-methyltransferase